MQLELLSSNVKSEQSIYYPIKDGGNSNDVCLGDLDSKETKSSTIQSISKYMHSNQQPICVYGNDKMDAYLGEKQLGDKEKENSNTQIYMGTNCIIPEQTKPFNSDNQNRHVQKYKHAKCKSTISKLGKYSFKKKLELLKSKCSLHEKYDPLGEYTLTNNYNTFTFFKVEQDKNSDKIYYKLNVFENIEIKKLSIMCFNIVKKFCNIDDILMYYMSKVEIENIINGWFLKLDRIIQLLCLLHSTSAATHPNIESYSLVDMCTDNKFLAIYIDVEICKCLKNENTQLLLVANIPKLMKLMYMPFLFSEYKDSEKNIDIVRSFTIFHDEMCKEIIDYLHTIDEIAIYSCTIKWLQNKLSLLGHASIYFYKSKYALALCQKICKKHDYIKYTEYNANSLHLYPFSQIKLETVSECSQRSISSFFTDISKCIHDASTYKCSFFTPLPTSPVVRMFHYKT